MFSNVYFAPEAFLELDYGKMILKLSTSVFRIVNDSSKVQSLECYLNIDGVLNFDEARDYLHGGSVPYELSELDFFRT